MRAARERPGREPGFEWIRIASRGVRRLDKHVLDETVHQLGCIGLRAEAPDGRAGTGNGGGTSHSRITSWSPFRCPAHESRKHFEEPLLPRLFYVIDVPEA
jgi:hypothetical protein